MKALCYHGKNSLQVDTVKDPEILNPQDVILRVVFSSVCGSDLHFIHGLIPGMKQGDILGHEFVGEVVETGAAVKNMRKGDRVVVAPDIGCGECFYCQSGQWSLCDNSNPTGYVQEKISGYQTSGFYGCSHIYGGYAGSHAEYIRVPYGDFNCFKIPEELTYEQALFASDALSTGYMGADISVKEGDVVAVWGAGAVGLMAAKSAWVKGAARVIVIDKHPFRLDLAKTHTNAEVINYENLDVREELKVMTAGRGPDVCIDAVGMEASSTGVEDFYDKTKQKLRLQSDRPAVLRQIIMACRKGGILAVLGVYGGFVDKFPIGPIVTKGLTLKTGLVHAQKYIPELIEYIKHDRIDPTFLKTQQWSLEQGQDGYRMFSENRNHCLRGVFAL